MLKVERPTEPVEPRIEIFFFIYLINIKVKKPKGTPKRIPSTLSNIPPWPGKTLPVSFTLAFLFRNEITKTPKC